MTEATALDGGAIAPDSGLALRRNVALVMLFVVGTINFVDRQLLSVLVEPIRAEMDFSDTQFRLLTGFAFALFYAAAGVPAIGRASCRERGCQDVETQVVGITVKTLKN